MKAITIRLPEDLAIHIEQQANTNMRSQQQEIIARLEASRNDPIVLGYIKIDRPGDLAIGDDCPVCDEPAQSWWLQIASNGETHHMCGQCATSE